MLRYLFQGAPPSQRIHHMMKSPSSAWNGAWKRMYTSSQQRLAPKSQSTISGAAWRMAATSTRPTFRAGSHGAFKSAPASRRGFRFSSWWRSNANGEQPEKLSLTARLKKLSKEYGWSVIGIYLTLSVLDFPFCFLLVRVVGTEKIGKLEHYVVSSATNMIPDSVRAWWRENWAKIKKTENETLGNGDVSGTVEMMGWGVETAQEHHDEEASLATQLALAYAIHKSFIFIRVPLTAAITPKVVKTLRGWGWNIGKNIGKRKPKA